MKLPSASMRQMTRPIDSIGGVMAVENMPLRAKPSQIASSTSDAGRAARKGDE